MNSTEIKSILRSPYNRENWKNLYRTIFQNKVTFFEFPHSYNINEEIVESLYQIGYVTLDDEYIVALFEVNIKSNVNLLSKKIGLRKVISKYISDDKFNGVLTIFENGSLDYRFTFASKTTKVTETGIEVSETESKRYTYILGGNEPCLTPSQRFEGLLKKNGSINLDDIKEAFSVDKLNKEFFNGYKEHYELFCDYFYSSKYKSITFKDDEKLIRDFVKKFLGRIVFLYFVQKKGWMGVKFNNDWGTGDHQFLSNLFKHFQEKDKFYSKILSSIFFDFLSVDRKDDVVELYKGYKIRIPYLNGGLFEKDSVDESEINFRESDLFSLFTFFDRFNFTIYEDDPNEHTVAVDPEMLGHIFENLLEDNRDKGAFYTPKEIVHYMCQESLIEYLTTWFKNKGYEVSGFSSIDKPNEQKLFSENEGRIGQLVIESQNFIKKKIIDRLLIEKLLKKKLNDDDKDLIVEYTKEFNSALDSVKICDPAIGSGAFPMGLLQEIFITKQSLWNFEYGNIDNFPSSEIKLNIIQNSIYGVDIEKGAVDIARLRFWLSLIVEEDEPKSLPNLDFKIVVGNSLVSLFDKDLIQIDWDIKFKNVDSIKNLILDQQKNLYQLDHLQHLYFQSFTKKGQLSLQIKKLKIDILVNQLVLTKIHFIENNPTEGGLFPSEKDLVKNQENKSFVENIEYVIEKLEKIRVDDKCELNYFDWRLNFPEIFDSKISNNPGFDIIIANPPYVGVKGNHKIFDVIKKSKLSKFSKGRSELFYFFMHQSLLLGKKNCINTFITTNYYITASDANILRKTLKEETTLLKLLNFNELKLFPSALGQHNIITIFKNGLDDSGMVKSLSTKRRGLPNDNILTKIFDFSDPETEYYSNFHKDIFEGENCYIRIEGVSGGSVSLNSIFEKINTIQTLGDICYVRQGLRTGIDKITDNHIEKFNFNGIKGEGVFILNESELNEKSIDKSDKLIKPLFKNSDIEKYISKCNPKKYLIYTDNSITLNELKLKHTSIYNHLIKFKDLITKIRSQNNEDSQNWFMLDRPRESWIFENEKIVVPQRSKTNTFGFNSVLWYSSADVYYIKSKSDKFLLKYLLGLLNSKLFFIWISNKGKRKGDMLELYQQPLSEIPIKNVEMGIQFSISNFVDSIIYLKSDNKDSSYLEKKLDIIFYKIYNLSYNEVKIIDSNFELSEDEYILINESTLLLP